MIMIALRCEQNPPQGLSQQSKSSNYLSNGLIRASTS